MASSVGFPMKRSAASVATTWTESPRNTKARTTLTALYAAMPPVIPTTIVRADDILRARAWRRWLFDDRTRDELVLVDFAQGHGQRLVVDGRVDERSDVVEQAAFVCLLYTSPSPRDGLLSRMPSSA